MNPFLDSNIGPLKEPTSKHLMDNLSLLTPVQVSNGNIEHKSSVSSPSPNKSSTLKIGETWSGLNSFNFDNILDVKSPKPAAPTINQLVMANQQQLLNNNNTKQLSLVENINSTADNWAQNSNSLI
ncbi:hypothetical protein NH340_JMT05959 [Sarcoptes scabiei]|nr:hypothetical protein NH340_JMT05959 [Sarcoptes scabiei]